ncbi:hypothetical protein BDW22DRAFT_1142002 [Trametopsis cervina]|nr:hypothetical protein BDW22DRAFT_1142002 [Trametopsis cervina]
MQHVYRCYRLAEGRAQRNQKKNRNKQEVCLRAVLNNPDVCHDHGCLRHAACAIYCTVLCVCCCREMCRAPRAICFRSRVPSIGRDDAGGSRAEGTRGEGEESTGQKGPWIGRRVCVFGMTRVILWVTGAPTACDMLPQMS